MRFHARQPSGRPAGHARHCPLGPCICVRYASSAPGPGGATVLAELPDEALPELALRLDRTVGHAGDFGGFCDPVSTWSVFGVQCWRLGKWAALPWLPLRWGLAANRHRKPQGARRAACSRGKPGGMGVRRSAGSVDRLSHCGEAGLAKPGHAAGSERRSATRVRKSAPVGPVVLRPDRWRMHRRREEPSPEGAIRSRSGFVVPE